MVGITRSKVIFSIYKKPGISAQVEIWMNVRKQLWNAITPKVVLSTAGQDVGDISALFSLEFAVDLDISTGNVVEQKRNPWLFRVSALPNIAPENGWLEDPFRFGKAYFEFSFRGVGVYIYIWGLYYRIVLALWKSIQRMSLVVFFQGIHLGGHLWTKNTPRNLK